MVTWDKLLEDAERLHRECREILKARAPEDDPRIQDLAVVEDEAPAEISASGARGSRGRSAKRAQTWVLEDRLGPRTEATTIRQGLGASL